MNAPEFLETFLKDVEYLAKKSAESGLETGFMVCEDKEGKLIKGQSCMGSECNVQLLDCKNKKKIGSFHIHPHLDMGDYFSPNDWLNAAYREVGWHCIGYFESNKGSLKIKCSDVLPKLAEEERPEMGKMYSKPSAAAIFLGRRQSLIDAAENWKKYTNEQDRKTEALWKEINKSLEKNSSEASLSIK